LKTLVRRAVYTALVSLLLGACVWSHCNPAPAKGRTIYYACNGLGCDVIGAAGAHQVVR